MPCYAWKSPFKRTITQLVQVQVALGPVAEVCHIAGLADHGHVELVAQLELLVLVCK